LVFVHRPPLHRQGFTLITRGRKRETLKGSATVELFPFLRELAEKPGVREYLRTELAISTKNKFPLVTLIDTPGLVDGNLKYPFNVEESLLWMADHCDLILIFFDPQGLALCRRTLRVVEALNKKNSEKLRYYLTRADEVWAVCMCVCVCAAVLLLLCVCMCAMAGFRVCISVSTMCLGVWF
jgi:hypothetical protein